MTLARAGLEVALLQVAATADERVAAARDAEAQADAQLATLADRTGSADPTRAFQRLEAIVHDLERESELAAAAGRPEHTIDVSLAENQQAMFELRSQVARHDQLVQARVQARRQELNATETSKAATIAARSATVDATVHRIGHWASVWLAGVAFGLAVILLVAGGLVGRLHFRWPFPLRRGAQSSPVDHAAPGRVETQRVEQRHVYLHSVPKRERDFYLALEPSRLEDSGLAPSKSVDLTGEEALDQGLRAHSDARSD